MRHSLAFCLVLAIALPCHAQGGKPKPNTLTPKEVADGWILFFDGETASGWKTKGPVPIDNGQWLLGGEEQSDVETNTHFGDGVIALTGRDAEPTAAAWRKRLYLAAERP